MRRTMSLLFLLGHLQVFLREQVVWRIMQWGGQMDVASRWATMKPGRLSRPRVRPLERAALGLAKTTDRTSWVESEVVGLRAAMADGSAKAEEVRRGIAGLKAEISDCCPKVAKDLPNRERELAKLKEEIITMKQTPELFAPPAADVPHAPKAAAPARKSSNSPPPPNVTPPEPKLLPVKVSPQPHPPTPAKQFPPSVNKGKIEVEGGWGRNERTLEVEFDVPHGIIAPALSGHLGELIAVVGLRGGSRVTGGLSARGLASVAVRDWPTISRLSLVIIAISVGHLLRSSCHLGFPKFIGLMRRSRR
jgi:hypothetical protein